LKWRQEKEDAKEEKKKAKANKRTGKRRQKEPEGPFHRPENVNIEIAKEAADYAALQYGHGVPDNIIHDQLAGRTHEQHMVRHLLLKGFVHLLFLLILPPPPPPPPLPLSPSFLILIIMLQSINVWMK
jgi:hypothetical protein